MAPKRREAQRDAYCRSCDGLIPKGHQMVSLYSFRNRGQHIYFHIECAKEIGELANES